MVDESYELDKLHAYSKEFHIEIMKYSVILYKLIAKMPVNKWSMNYPPNNLKKPSNGPG